MEKVSSGIGSDNVGDCKDPPTHLCSRLEFSCGGGNLRCMCVCPNPMPRPHVLVTTTL